MSAHSDAELKIRRSLSPCWQSEWSSICQLTPVPCRAPCSGPYCDATEHLPSPMGKRGKGASLPDKDSGEKAPVAAGKAAPTRKASTAAVTQPKAANSAPTTKAAAATKASAAVDKPAARAVPVVVRKRRWVVRRRRSNLAIMLKVVVVAGSTSLLERRYTLPPSVL